MYKAEITEFYSRDGHTLSVKEKVKFKDTTGCLKLDEATQEGEVLIDPASWGVLHIKNDRSESGEYDNYVVADRSGVRYVTGSSSFWRSFMDIVEEMQGEEDWSVRVYRSPSKNYKGKDFITCSVE